MKTKDNKSAAKAKKEFREHPTVEQLYKTIYQYNLVEDAYKATIQLYIQLKK